MQLISDYWNMAVCHWFLLLNKHDYRSQMSTEIEVICCYINVYNCYLTVTRGNRKYCKTPVDTLCLDSEYISITTVF